MPSLCKGKSLSLRLYCRLFMHLDNFIFAALILLAAASISVALFKRLGLGSVLGMLAAGIIVGPHSPGPYITEHVEDVRHFAELGVVMLLFLIGLEMRPARLWAMRREVFGLGTLQILVSGLAIAAYIWLYQSAWQISLLIGLTMALSSTAFVLQLMQERGEVASAHGSVTFAVLLMQDLAIVPLLAAVPLLSASNTIAMDHPWRPLLAVGLSFVAVWLFGRYLVPAALERLMRQGNREGFSLVVMLTVIFAAWAMHQAGLSMALGAFVMGMLLSGSRYNYQIQSYIEPYKGLLMGLFFVAVGMSIDFLSLSKQPWVFAQHVAVIITIKIAVMFVLALAFRITRPAAIRISFLLAQSGEFGFVLFGSAKVLRVIDDTIFVTAIGVISVSMLLTPLLRLLGDSWARRLEKTAAPNSDFMRPEDNRRRVIIGGYGRVGHTVATLLHANDIPFIAFDTNPSLVAHGMADGFPVYYGDIGDPALLTAAHTQDAALVVLTIDSAASALRAVHHIRSYFPMVPVIARARDLATAGQLLQAGATEAYPEAIESSLRLASLVLHRFGVSDEDVNELMREVRAEDYAPVRSSNPR